MAEHMLNTRILKWKKFSWIDNKIRLFPHKWKCFSLSRPWFCTVYGGISWTDLNLNTRYWNMWRPMSFGRALDDDAKHVSYPGRLVQSVFSMCYTVNPDVQTTIYSWMVEVLVSLWFPQQLKKVIDPFSHFRHTKFESYRRKRESTN